MKIIFYIASLLILFNINLYSNNYTEVAKLLSESIEYPIFTYYDKKDLAPRYFKRTNNCNDNSLHCILDNLENYMDKDVYTNLFNNTISFINVMKTVYINKATKSMYVVLNFIPVEDNLKEGTNIDFIHISLKVIKRETYEVLSVGYSANIEEPGAWEDELPDKEGDYVNKDIENELFDELQRKP